MISAEYNVEDFTKNGECSNCGGCCMNLIPISSKELKKIKQYVKKHKIKELDTVSKWPTQKSNINLMCPFRDDINNCCTIYPVRPAICRDFICNKDCRKRRDFYLNKYSPCDLRLEVFNNNTVEKLLTKLRENNGDI